MKKNILSNHFRTILVLAVIFASVFSFTESYAYTSQTSSYAQKAASYVKSQIDRLERDDYTDEEIIDELVRLKRNFISRQRSSIYSGRSNTEVTLIVTELENAISWYSDRVDRWYSSWNSFYREPVRYYNNNTWHNNNSSYYYSYQQPSVSNQIIRVGETYSSTNSAGNTEIRTNFTRDNARSYQDFDVFTFVLQGNGSRNNVPESNQFLPTSSVRDVSISQWRNVKVLFGAEYRNNAVQTIRMAAQNAYRTSQSVVGLGSSFTDMYTSLSQDDFARQSLWSGYLQAYRMYKLYVAQDNSEAFVVEYQETGSLTNYYNWNNSYNYYR